MFTFGTHSVSKLPWRCFRIYPRNTSKCHSVENFPCTGIANLFYTILRGIQLLLERKPLPFMYMYKIDTKSCVLLGLNFTNKLTAIPADLFIELTYKDGTVNFGFYEHFTVGPAPGYVANFANSMVGFLSSAHGQYCLTLPKRQESLCTRLFLFHKVLDLNHSNKLNSII